MRRRTFIAGFGMGLALRSATPLDLDDLSRRCFRYFWEQSDPQTGITRGRARFDGSEYPAERRDVGSTGDTGFGITAMCIGAERGWVARADARERVRNTLRAFADGPVKNEHGWFYHWINIKSGERTGATFDSAVLKVPEGKNLKRPKSEVSTSDSTWLVCGALTARQYFKEDAEIGRLAGKIYERMDYQWMRNGHATLLAHGWMPEEGFLKARYEKYCQLAAMYLLGVGAPGHPLPAEAWYAWERNPYEYGGYKYIGNSLLWTYQYPFAWFDLRGRKERTGIDWFENSATATRAHRKWCMERGYSAELWGVTSSMSKSGYRAWGGPPEHGNVDGSVVPCAAAGSLMFTPEISKTALGAMAQVKGVYGRYGLADAFHPETGWVAEDTIGLDVGITLLAAENLRAGSVWKWFGSSGEVRKALELAELRKG